MNTNEEITVFATANTVFPTVLRDLNKPPYWIFFFKSTLSLKKKPTLTFLAVAFTMFFTSCHAAAACRESSTPAASWHKEMMAI